MYGPANGLMDRRAHFSTVADRRRIRGVSVSLAETADPPSGCIRRVARATVLFVLLIVLLAQGKLSAQATPDREAAAAQLRESATLVEQQRWDEAESALRAYLADNPASDDAMTMLGSVLFERDRPEESIEAFQAVAAHRKLKAGELKTMALDYATVGKMEEARKSLMQSVALDGGDQGAWEALGHVQVEMHRDEEAIKSFQRVLELAPKTAFAATEIGLASERISRLDDAAKAFGEAIEWQAGDAAPDPMPFIALGKVLIIQDKPEQALAPLRRVLEFDADDSRVHEQLGRAYLGLDRLDAARTELEEAVRLDAASARSHLALSQVYRKLGRKEDAAAQIKLYTELSAKKAAAAPASSPTGSSEP